jgi:hypothetical protein
MATHNQRKNEFPATITIITEEGCLEQNHNKYIQADFSNIFTAFYSSVSDNRLGNRKNFLGGLNRFLTKY